MTASRDRALAAYRLLAAGYGESCQRSWDVRVSAIERLMLRDGQTVFDVACGTGETLVELAKGVGPSGRIVGIEQCPEMATLARKRIEAAGLGDRVRLIVAPVEEALLDESADAVLFCYTHDVLQTPGALANLFAHVRPGARVSVTGVRLQPWLWGWPLNLVTLYRTRRYLTTFRGLSRPWESLREYCPDIEIVRALHLGTGYLAAGRFGRVELQSTVTCPHCGFRKEETMPTDACQYLYECEGCKALLKPNAGDCCVFCSFGSVRCPPIQEQRSCGGQTGSTAA